jgi:hypothetical protein
MADHHGEAWSIPAINEPLAGTAAGRRRRLSTNSEDRQIALTSLDFRWPLGWFTLEDQHSRLKDLPFHVERRARCPFAPLTLSVVGEFN